MVFKIISNPKDINKKEWENFVQEHPEGNPFHNPQMFEFFHQVDNYKPVVLIYKGKERKILGVLMGMLQKEPGIKSFFSRRCIVWGGPLVKDNDPAVARQIIISFTELVKNKSIYIEFRNLFSTEKIKEAFLFSGFKWHDHLNFIVTLDSRENVIKRISSGKLRQIKKGLSKGAEIIKADNISQVEQFYEILKILYKNKVKKPLPSFSFFKNFFNDKSLGKYLLINYKNQIIGGIMCSVYKYTIYEWYIASLDNEYKSIYPGVLATWAPINYALDHHLKYFDFMGAGSPDDDYGVREFKSKFGGELVNYGRFVRINKPLLYHIGKLGLKMLQKLS